MVRTKLELDFEDVQAKRIDELEVISGKLGDTNELEQKDEGIELKDRSKIYPDLLSEVRDRSVCLEQVEFTMLTLNVKEIEEPRSIIGVDFGRTYGL